MRYIVTENELLSIFKAFKEFQTILSGQQIKYILAIKITHVKF